MITNMWPRVYLAGPIGPRGSEKNGDWRETATDFLEENLLLVVEPLEAGKYPHGVEGHVGKILTDRDRRFTTQSEYMLVNFSDAFTRSMGTCIELGWADLSPTTTVTVLPEDNPHQHPMVKAVSDYIVDDLQEGLDIIVSLAADRLDDHD